MIIHVASLTFNGIDITDVNVQVQISPGIPAFTIGSLLPINPKIQKECLSNYVELV